jgi:hypothetical protein
VNDPAPNSGFMPHVGVLKPTELSFVRSSMKALEERRRGCAQCRRTPLVGETVYLFGEDMVCELCRRLRTDQPERSEVVHSAEYELTVKRRSAA